MLWIALYLPELPLQIMQRTICDERPVAISDGPALRPIVFAVNASAMDRGVKRGMSVAAARALSGELLVLPREPNREAQALHTLACWAYQFTPCVSVQPEQGLLLEVTSTLRLHKGLAQLLARIRQEALDLGYHAVLGVAPTPTAAWLFSKARHTGCAVRTCTDPTTLAARLKDIPLVHFDWPTELKSTLAALGVVRIGRCIALPRDGFARRFGEALLLDLDKAMGRIPDPRPFFSPPERFTSRVEFGFEVSDAMTLLFPLKRLLRELEGYLRGRGAGVQEWCLVLEQSGGLTTPIAFSMALPERNAGRLAELARERFHRTELAAPVRSIRVEADRLFPYDERSESWLPDSKQQAIGWFHLIDRLTARLGADKVYHLESCEDHRPEKSFRRVGALNQVRARPVALATAPRPLWLLAVPRSLLTERGQPRCQGALRLIAGPERIEAGWWDGRPAGRDYFVARNPHGETFWIYRDHYIDTRWYLHGVFA